MFGELRGFETEAIPFEVLPSLAQSASILAVASVHGSVQLELVGKGHGHSIGNVWGGSIRRPTVLRSPVSKNASMLQ